MIVTPGDAAYALVAESIDRSGMGVATLAPREGMRAAVPALRERPVLTMKDMGHGEHGSWRHGMGRHGGGAARRIDEHARQVEGRLSRSGPGVDMIAPMPVDRIGDPGIGLDDVGHKVLNYKRPRRARPGKDQRTPTRRIDIHLTGNMERFMWSMDGREIERAARALSLRAQRAGAPAAHQRHDDDPPDAHARPFLRAGQRPRLAPAAQAYGARAARRLSSTST